MKDNWMKKGLVVSVIILFLSVAVAPSINFNVVKASNDNDLVEVTTQACGISGFGNTTVKFTRQQYQHLEQYLVDFRTRLNQTTTREEAVPLFKEAVGELNKYGLLPRGMSVEQAQRLVTGPYQNTKLLKCLEKLSNKSGKSSLQQRNKFCLIYGEAQSHTVFQGPVSRAICNVLYILAEISSNFNIAFSLYLLCMIPSTISIVFSKILRDLPYIGASIYYGTEYWTYLGSDYSPAQGYIWTNGLYGTKNWSGQFYGQLSSMDLICFNMIFYPGVNGFTGLRLYVNSTDFYFGNALDVNLGPNCP